MRYHQLIPQPRAKQLVEALREKGFDDRNIPWILEKRLRKGEFTHLITHNRVLSLIQAGIDLSPYPFIHVTDESVEIQNVPQNVPKENVPKNETFLKLSEASKRLDVSRSTLDRMLNEGKIKFKTTKGGHRLIPESEIEM